MPEIDTNLASKLKQAMSNPMCFAFVGKGSSEGKLILDKKKVSSKEIADARKEIGGGTVFKGRCFGDEGNLVFEITKDPPGSLVAQIKKVIQTDARLSLNVDMRVNASAESEEEEAEQPSPQETPPPAPPAPASPAPTPTTGASTSGGAKVIKRLNELSAEIKAAIADGARVTKLFGSLNDLLKKKDFDQVEKVLDELEALVQRKPR